MGKKGKLDPATIAMVIIDILLAIWFINNKKVVKVKNKENTQKDIICNISFILNIFNICINTKDIRRKNV